MQGTSGYDIVVYPDGSTSIRKKRSEVLTPNFPSQLPTFLSLKLKVYLSKSWNVSIIMYFFSTHCVFLEHYYWVDFPWWFDRKMSFFSFLCKTAYNMMIGKKMLSNDRNSKLHFVIWQKNCFSWQIWTEISNQSRNQIF